VPPDAHAFWVVRPGVGELRSTPVPPPGAGEVCVRTLHTAISRGTETVVFGGGVPERERRRMRAPFQEGDFPGPVKYGYLNVGVVEAGPSDLRGRTVFCLYPHQTRYVVPEAAVTVVPDDVPPERAVLAGTVETAVNLAWDARPWVGERIAVVGAGMVGACVARLLAGFPGTVVTLIDVDPTRALVADALGVGFALPDEAPRDRDLVVHASATEAGLQLSLDLLATEGTVWDLSWYGDRPVSLGLGGAFHSSRLAIRASQVGMVANPQRSRRSTAERLALALDLLRDPGYDAVVTDRSPFAELPTVLADIAAGRRPGLCHVIDYDRRVRKPSGSEAVGFDREVSRVHTDRP
jgi:NADPH:quinone reductase-like Zn-dependent oxidoreductase